MFYTVINKFFLALIVSVSPLFFFGQCSDLPTLSFTNYQLESGVAGQVGAMYRFTRVLDTIDALVTIHEKVNARLIDLDVSYFGDDMSFQPQVMLRNQSYYGTEGYMDFKIEFVKTGTMELTNLTKWTATAVDLDGDGSRLRESVGFSASGSYVFNSPTDLAQMMTGVNDDDEDDEDDEDENDDDDETSNSLSISTLFECNTVDNQPDISTTAPEHMVYLTFSANSGFLYRARIIDNGGYYASDAADRLFSLNMSPCVINQFGTFDVFPVELTHFSGAFDQSGVTLEWATASELNNDHFLIQRSVDGVAFEDLGSVVGAGTTQQLTNYTYTDNDPISDDLYYRLKQVDMDGSFHFSHIIRLTSVSSFAPSISLTVYPNPASTNVTIESQSLTPITSVSVIDLQGNEVLRQAIEQSASKHMVNLEHLNQGVYILKVQAGMEQYTKRMLVK